MPEAPTAEGFFVIMGYLTAYELETSSINNEEIINNLRSTNEYAEYALDEDGNTQESCKWYNHEEDLKEFSKKNPEIIFFLTGVGEEAGDMWRKYFKNGKMQTSKASITYEPYNEGLLN